MNATWNLKLFQKFQGSECPTFSNILVDRLACQSDPATFRIYRDIQNAQDDLSITSSGDSTVYTFSGLSSIADPCREKFIDDVQFCLVSETAIFWFSCFESFQQSD